VLARHALGTAAFEAPAAERLEVLDPLFDGHPEDGSR
jgi:hypothetical protein